MAKVIVEIDLPNWKYEDLKKDIFDDPSNAWWENEDPTTGKIAIDKINMEEDSMDNSFYLFKLIDIME